MYNQISLLTSFRKVFWVSSSQRISSFITITSPVSLWVTCRNTHTVISSVCATGNGGTFRSKLISPQQVNSGNLGIKTLDICGLPLKADIYSLLECIFQAANAHIGYCTFWFHLRPFCKASQCCHLLELLNTEYTAPTQ